jgi:hypothetical protein
LLDKNITTFQLNQMKGMKSRRLMSMTMIRMVLLTMEPSICGSAGKIWETKISKDVIKAAVMSMDGAHLRSEWKSTLYIAAVIN